MSKKAGNTKQSKLLQLYNNKLLRSKVDAMLDENKPFSYILNYLKTKKFYLSAGSLSNYRKKRIEALQKNIPLKDLIDRRKKGSIIYLDTHNKDDNEDDPVEEEPFSPTSALSSHPNPAYVSDIEFLDEIIGKAKKTLQGVEVLDVPLALKAIDLKDKLTGGNLHGMTIEGLRAYKLKEDALSDAMVSVIMSYIPEDKHEEVYSALEKAQQDFYDNLDLTDGGKKLKKAVNDLGLDL